MLKTLVISVLGFIATEILLYTATMAVSSKPFTLLVASTFALWFWLGIGLSHEAIKRFHARFTDDADFIHVPAARVMSGLLSLIIGIGCGPWLLHTLWASGNFGEPPWNRYVEFRVLKDHQGIEHRVAEFGVVLMPTGGFSVGLMLDHHFRDDQFFYWIDPPSLAEIPKDRSRSLMDGFIVGSWREDEWFSADFPSHSVNLDDSLYVDLGAERFESIVVFHFQSIDRLNGFWKHVKLESVPTICTIKGCSTQP